LTWILIMVYDLGDCKAQGAALKAIFYGYWKSLAPLQVMCNLQVMFTMCVQTDLLLCSLSWPFPWFLLLPLFPVCKVALPQLICSPTLFYFYFFAPCTSC
jgi:hypothetical protein